MFGYGRIVLICFVPLKPKSNLWESEHHKLDFNVDLKNRQKYKGARCVDHV